MTKYKIASNTCVFGSSALCLHCIKRFGTACCIILRNYICSFISMYHPLRIFLVGKYNYLVQEMGGRTTTHFSRLYSKTPIIHFVQPAYCLLNYFRCDHLLIPFSSNFADDSHFLTNSANEPVGLFRYFAKISSPCFLISAKLSLTILILSIIRL